ncbi:MAG: glycosyltransferase family 4 protein [Victivallaceae bacterium]|nr:glycosyltransferase family 4 protein [Victivallaceae bacterium]
MTRNRIVFYLPQVYPADTGGLEVFAYCLVKALCRKMALTVISDVDLELPNVTAVKAWKHRPLRFFLPFRLLLLFFRFNGKKTLFYFSYANRMHPLLLLTVAAGAKFFRFRYAVTVHSGKCKQWRPEWIFRLFFNGAETLTAVSEALCKLYAERLGRPVELTPPYIPFERAPEEAEELKGRHGIPAGARVILCLGSLKALKSPETALKMMAALGGQYIQERNLFLLFAGDGPLRESLENEAKADGALSGRVKFLGNVPRENVPQLFKLSEFYLSCSEYEGQSISLTEAMFNALKIVVADSPGLNTVITHGKNGLLFPFHDAAAAAAQLKSLADNSDIALRLAEAARNDYENKFTFDRVLEQWLAIFSRTGRTA